MPRWLLLAVSVLLACLRPASASADALSDFESAERAYGEQRYAIAVGILEGLLASIDPETAGSAVVSESRKYLGAAYLFLGREQDADRQFRLLLLQDRGYQIDPVVFPDEVVRRFEAVRRAVDAERAAEREAALAEAEARVADQETRLAEERARYAALYELAASSPVYRRNSRIVALLPFGIGQFQNDRRRLGRFFAVAEALTLATYATAFVWYNQLGRVEDVADADLNRWYNARTGARWTNWMSGAAFLTLTIAGAVEAEVNFVPTRTSSAPRTVPDNFRPEGAAPVARLQLTPTRLVFRLDF